MKRLWLAIGVLMLASILIVGWLVIVPRSSGRTPENWRATLDQYLDQVYAVSETRPTVIATVRADQVTNFQETDFVTFGQGEYFSIDVHYPITETAQSAEPPVQTSEQARLGGRPLPYPPVELWCVQLQHADGKQAVVFVAQHEDMFIAEWVMHVGETAPFSPEFVDFVKQVGCALSF